MPGLVDDFDFWQRAVGDMSAGLQGALIGGGAVIIGLAALVYIERYWANVRAIRPETASAVLKSMFAFGPLACDGLIPLADAMAKAWRIKEVRQLPEFEKLARERPQDVPRRLAERLFDGRDTSLSIVGVVGDPPIEHTVEHPHECKFSNDLKGMVHIFDDDLHYRDLRVRWPDIRTNIRQRTEDVIAFRRNPGNGRMAARLMARAWNIEHARSIEPLAKL